MDTSSLRAAVRNFMDKADKHGLLRAPLRRWQVGGIAGTLAAAATAAALVISSGGQAPQAAASVSAAPRMSAGVIRALDKVTPAQWQELAADMVGSYARITRAGTGPLPAEGTTLTAADFAAGYNGHFWVTASYADFLDGVFAKAISAAENYCIEAGTDFVDTEVDPEEDDLTALEAAGLILLVRHDCDSVGKDLTSWADGRGWSTSHGVWATVSMWPPKVQIGRW